MIYLDHAAAAPLCDEALRAMEEAQREVWCNPSAVYSAAGAARKALENARRKMAELLCCLPEQVLFSSSCTEGNTQCLYSFSGKNVVLSAQEHPSLLAAARQYAGKVTLLYPDENGRISPESAEKAIKENAAALLCVQAVNHETGVLQPVSAFAEIAHRHGAFLLADAAQAFGRVPLSAQTFGADFMTGSAHKFGGPRGAGFLYVSAAGRKVLRPLFPGRQENGLRAGTENVPALAGMAAAAERAVRSLSLMNGQEALLQEFFCAVSARIPSVRWLGQNAKRAPGILALFLPGYPSEIALCDLDEQGVCASGGAACATGFHEESPAYRAFLPAEKANQVLRISTGAETSREELLSAAHILCACCRHYAETHGECPPGHERRI